MKREKEAKKHYTLFDRWAAAQMQFRYIYTVFLFYLCLVFLFVCKVDIVLIACKHDLHDNDLLICFISQWSAAHENHEWKFLSDWWMIINVHRHIHTNTHTHKLTLADSYFTLLLARAHLYIFSQTIYMHLWCDTKFANLHTHTHTQFIFIKH